MTCWRRSGRALALVLAMLLGAGAARAQTVSYAEAAGLLAQHCGADIMTHCRGLNLGNGAIHQCLASKAAQLSPACAANHEGVKQMTEARAAAQAAVFKVCDRDRAEYCPGVEAGDGNIVSCLLKASRVVSQSCTAAIVNAGYR
ncbi:hypothetical protein [Xanthobacter pseudotagetidis]|uniref:hypothetical protein n=1 Tax=Xanthobacter pseudotagetidis TaxID=3119911 RepID=UPI0037266A88